jgi:hypothetical protein
LADNAATVTADETRRLEQRVVEAAEAALAEKRFVTTIDIFVRVGWLAPRLVDRWRQGRVAYLEDVVQVNPSKLSTALRIFRRWAERRALSPSETAYAARTRDRRPLRFTGSGDPAMERAYRTHWISTELSKKQRERLRERQSQPPELVVIAPRKDWTCTECGGSGDLLTMEGPRPLCLRCADMDHLVFLAAGTAALTRRASKASRLSAVVVRFSPSRRRYERQGLLVEGAALESAEKECLADEEARARRRVREETRRVAQDVELQTRMAREIARLFPGCPAGRAAAIARHAGMRGSGRVGRTGAGRALDPEAIELAVAASVRHLETRYDELLMSGFSRAQARERVLPEVELVLDRWRQG